MFPPFPGALAPSEGRGELLVVEGKREADDYIA